jgi:hypothetical protein
MGCTIGLQRFLTLPDEKGAPLKYTIPALTLCLAVLSAGPVLARPQYAIREGRPCAYCHVNPKGGGARNPRGEYYQAHKFSFDGYDEAAVMGKYLPSLFKAGWKDTVPANVRKVAVADTVGDGTSRMVLLSEGASSEARTVTVRKWNGTAWVDEFTADVPGGQDRLAVGKYGASGPAVIVKSGAMWFWNGKRYEQRPAPHALDILGTVALKDGAERLLLKEGASVKLYRVDTSSPNWLANPTDPLPSGQTSFTEMKGRTEELEAIGLPEPLAAGGIIGFWNAPKPNAQYLYAVQIVALLEDKNPGSEKETGKGAQDFVLKGTENHITVVDPRLTAYKTLWQSEKLDGRVLDVALGDPRSGARGLTVLTDKSPDGKGHTLYFFKLE